MLKSHRRVTGNALAVLLTVAAATVAIADASHGSEATPGKQTASTASPYSKSMTLPTRLQWNTNYGYCGEASFISAGMRLGQYTSQWTARTLASGGIPQWQQRSQLLLGTAPSGNALTAASSMKLTATARNTSQASTPTFLAWVKQQFVAGNAVILGVFNNVNILDESGSGDPYYDHIVSVLRIGSQSPLTGANAGTYFATDTLTISDNGLYTPHPNSAANVPGNTANNPAGSALYTSRFGAFQKTRAQANRGTSVTSLYSLRNASPNFAVAVTGIVDQTAGGPVTIPVRLTSNTNNEGFQNQNYMRAAPAATPITLAVKVTIPNQAIAYKLYRFNSFASVPTANFNSNASRARQTWTIPAHSGSTFTVNVPAKSSDTQVFRAVPTTAP